MSFRGRLFTLIMSEPVLYYFYWSKGVESILFTRVWTSTGGEDVWTSASVTAESWLVTATGDKLKFRLYLQTKLCLFSSWMQMWYFYFSFFFNLSYLIILSTTASHCGSLPPGWDSLTSLIEGKDTSCSSSTASCQWSLTCQHLSDKATCWFSVSPQPRPEKSVSHYQEITPWAKNISAFYLRIKQNKGLKRILENRMSNIHLAASLHSAQTRQGNWC